MKVPVRLMSAPPRPHRFIACRLLSVLEGFYWRTEFSLVGGYVLHDYLAEPRPEVILTANVRALSSM